MADLPTVKVSPTLAELYPALNKFPIALVPIIVLSNQELTEDVPRSSKFLYQDTTTINHQDGDHLSGDGPSPTIKYLSLVPQRFAFAAGNMPVVVFDMDLDPETASKNRQQALDTLAVLEEESRPVLHFFDGPSDTRFSPDKWTLADSFPMDGLESHMHVLETELHYELLSKGGLAASGLKTPGCLRLEVKSVSGPFDQCCESCLGGGLADVIAEECSGHRGKWLTEEVDKILVSVKGHSVPFVLKFQQTVSGAGTYIVTTAAELDSLLEELPVILRAHLPKINPKNKHMDPGDVLITELVKDIKETLPLTFFVQEDGKCVFICCAEQHLNDEGQYAGATITYSQQDKLQKRLAGSMAKIGDFLHSKGYYGPVGADILEDGAGVQWVVDLNVRTPSSLVLGVLKEHFQSKGLDVATLISSNLRVNRKGFFERFAEDLKAGRIVIVGWHEEGDRAWAELVLAGASREDVERLKERVERT